MPVLAALFFRGGCDGHGVISHPYSGRQAASANHVCQGLRVRLARNRQSIQFTRSNLLRKSSGMTTTWLVL